ncbi:phosphate/phosphite/phosphonate ABC transporter substrate-binding protein [uncultured Roseibium sp.]|uniref:phosphate/phosphite/phosphonate ABC transporter substrate-binding protein n=1 Tax=uncultured Roseibium sp. TaxID=1936171 RepID=UPI00261487E2|nr:phosphate/phosphite/phosphonate ABC transporter substrate-binding protein [uncultured Roseibium sp.]
MTIPSILHVPQNNSRLSALSALLLQSGAAFLLFGNQPVHSETVYTFGVVPQQSASRLAQVWIPLLEELEKSTGYKFQFATAKDIPTFEACLNAKAYDFAYMNPYHYTVFHERAGYQAFAHQADKKLKGILVARTDSNIDDLNQLQHAKVAFPSPAAFGASVVPRAELTSKNISFEPSYVKSHDSVYRSVALGLFPAGGGVGRTFDNIPDELRAQLKVIYKTDDYTPHAFAASAEVHADDRNAVAAALIGMTEENILKSLGMTGFVSASNDNWDDVRSLNLSVGQTEIVSAGEEKCHSS